MNEVDFHCAGVVFSLAGCALVVAWTFPENEAGSSRRAPIGWLDRAIPYGMYPFAIGVIAFGVDHYLYLYSLDVATLAPAWILGHICWTYFAGTGLIASGVAMIPPVSE